MQRLITKIAPAFFVVVLLLSGQALASQVFESGGLAIRGYDPVAYFTDGAAKKGDKAYRSEWNGTTWQFSSTANKETFDASPEKYAPQYGGYCAWAVSRNYTASIDPDAWHIEDGKLYLNFSKGVQRRWAQDIPGNISKGDGNWPRIRAGL